MKNLISKLNNGITPLVIKSSYYFEVNDTTIIVSNHLPNSSNWYNNENKEKKVFIFIDEYNNLPDTKIEKYLENEFGSEFQYFLFDTEEEAIEAINYIKSQI